MSRDISQPQGTRIVDQQTKDALAVRVLTDLGTLGVRYAVLVKAGQQPPVVRSVALIAQHTERPVTCTGQFAG